MSSNTGGGGDDVVSAQGRQSRKLGRKRSNMEIVYDVY